MAALGTYCFDGLNFSQATSLFTDSGLTTLAPDGWYSQGGIIRQQLNGVLLNAQPCSECLVPCGSGVEGSFSANGLFTATVDLGNTIGASILYFFMGNAIPDGVGVTYNGTQYNRLTCGGNHNTTSIVDGSGTTVDYAGIGNQGTGNVTYVGSDTQVPQLLAQSPFNNIPSGSCSNSDKPQDYTLTGNPATYVAQGTYQTVTAVSAQVGCNPTGSQVFTLVVPKTTSSPTVVTVLISAPLCGTLFRWEVDCPIVLPNFTASAIQSTTACAAATTTYYFARNATGQSTPFSIDTNTTPNIGNWVFSDANGSTYLNDTSTIKYYIISGTTALGVRNGVVVSRGNCAGTSNSPFFATSGTTTLNDGTCGNATGTLLYHNGSGTLPQVGDTIYTSSSGTTTVTWSNYRGMGPADVADGVVDTATVNGSGVVQTIFSCP
jgi:hypothetical protein